MTKKIELDDATYETLKDIVQYSLDNDYWGMSQLSYDTASEFEAACIKKEQAIQEITNILELG